MTSTALRPRPKVRRPVSVSMRGSTGAAADAQPTAAGTEPRRAASPACAGGFAGGARPQPLRVTLVQILDLLGVAVFAVSGALAAVRRRLDLLGVVVIAMVTAIGGGTTRDLLLDRAVFWTTQPRYLYVIIASALLTVVWTRRFRPPDRALAIADALGLALFAISGAQIAARVGMPGIVCVIMGTITGVAGGMIRDVLTAEIPMVIRRGQIYATAAIAGIVVWLVLRQSFGLEEPAAAIAGMVVIAGLRISAIAWDWTLPVFSLEEAGRGLDAPGRADRSDRRGR
jgi:uncharacterized membrane protein YeiH